MTKLALLLMLRLYLEHRRNRMTVIGKIGGHHE